ncbi:hypothetical protein PWEIH_10318 [Listeria weihenstephanensis FSL R9-0317]|uniref:BIG2 domain-containing protein n=1 Tax=Listeria weihenstephanensis TaxID=1006155 RepID=A0A1S7FXX3_9LIST|nr:immunoglobulin-like domain-containing protein [Listeria weihenstephanensis]AQY52286.1 hypothetical protein UE46_15520 [Listeria weihenstephanensis]EUJ37364.1 hypothetical protein PWEIH_10318 [Listeria weihenstephanensis FSL R9-0317]
MKQNMKKIALALVVTNVVASSIITALPPVQTHAAEQKLTTNLQASSAATVNYVSRNDTQVTGHVPSDAGKNVTIEVYDTVLGQLHNTYTGSADASGNYAVPITSIGTRKLSFRVKVTFDNGTTITQDVDDFNVGNFQPILNKTTREVTGKLENCPNTTLLVDAAPFRSVPVALTDANGNFAFTIPTEDYSPDILLLSFTLYNSQGVYMGYVGRAINPISLNTIPAVTFNVTGLNTNPQQGDTGKMTTSVLPANASQVVNYSSSDTSVMSVDSNGNWKAVGSGKANITVTSATNTAIATTIPVTVGSFVDPATIAAVNALFIDNNPANSIKDTTNQAAIDAAQNKVNAATDTIVRSELQKQIDKAKKELAAKTEIAQATASVNNLFSNAPTNTLLKDSTTQAMIDSASAQVNALAASKDKTKLQGDIANANDLFNQIAPTTIGGLTTNSTMVSGKGEANSDIVIKNGTVTIASGRVASDGNYLVSITPQVAGSTITAMVTKASNGKTSSASTLIPAALDYSLKANSYKVGTANLTGTYGKNIAKVRLFVNDKLIIQATTSNGAFTFPNIASFITKPTDKVEVVGVDGSYVERARVAVAVTGDPVYDYSLTANDYTLGNATLTGKYGKDVSKVRLWVNNVVVSQATTNADGTYTFDKVPSFVKLTSDKVEVVGVNATYNEIARKTVKTKGTSILDTSLTANSYAKGSANLTGTYGKDISKVRLWVNGVVVQQATTSNGNYTFTNIASFIKNKEDVVEVVGVDTQYNEKNRITVTKTGFDTLDNSLTAPANFTLNKDTTINGTMGTNVSKVRLSVNGVVVKQAATTGGTYTIAGANNYITNATDVVKIIAVDAQYKEVASKTITVKTDNTVYDYALNVNPYLFGASTITGTYGKDVSAVRLFVNGTVVKSAAISNGTFTVSGLASITSATDKVEIVAVNMAYKEVARVAIQ